MMASKKNETLLTPTPTNIDKPQFTDVMTTPVGDHDKKPKIQLCLELRQKEVPITKSKSTRKVVEQNVLEVTVMWVKHLPQSRGKRPNPFVKLRLLPEGDIQITELQLEKHDAQYIEVFNFPLSKSGNVEKGLLEVQVCDNKATRNAKQFGSVSIPLTDLKFGKPSCEWYHLKGDESITKTSKENKLPKPKPKRNLKKKPHLSLELQHGENGNEDKVDQEVEDEESFKIHKPQERRHFPIHSDQED